MTGQERPHRGRYREAVLTCLAEAGYGDLPWVWRYFLPGECDWCDEGTEGWGLDLAHRSTWRPGAMTAAYRASELAAPLRPPTHLANHHPDLLAHLGENP